MFEASRSHEVSGRAEQRDAYRRPRMICPHCAHDNVPGRELCESCQQDLTQLDLPAPQDRAQRSLMEDPVSILGIRPPTFVGPNTSIREAIQKMIEDNVGAVLVLDEDKTLLGILTERDYLLKIIEEGASLEQSRVHTLMTPQPETVIATDTLAFALSKMDSGGYRHLPVMSHNQPVGIISVRDMLRHFTRLCANT